MTLLDAIAAAPRPVAEPCQHMLTKEAQRCRHDLYFGTTCRDCILSCPQCWDHYTSSASYGPRPTADNEHEYRLIAAAVGERGMTDASTPLYIRVQNLVEHWDRHAAPVGETEPGQKATQRKKKPELRCSQCGRTFRAKPCGFAHAEIGQWVPRKAKS